MKDFGFLEMLVSSVGDFDPKAHISATFGFMYLGSLVHHHKMFLQNLNPFEV